MSLLNHVDFADSNDQANRVLIDLREIIKHNNIKISDVFANFDSHHTGQLDINDFSKLIRVIAPKINDYEIKGLFAKFDENGDGTIDFKEFNKLLGYALPDQGSNNKFCAVSEKAMKILAEFRRIIIANKVDVA